MTTTTGKESLAATTGHTTNTHTHRNTNTNTHKPITCYYLQTSLHLLRREQVDDSTLLGR